MMRGKGAGDWIEDGVRNNTEFHNWAADRKLPRKEFVEQRAKVVHGKFSERNAKALCDDAARAGIFKVVGKRNKGDLFVWSPDGKPPPDDASGAVARTTPAPLHHSKKRGESHAD